MKVVLLLKSYFSLNLLFIRVSTSLSYDIKSFFNLLTFSHLFKPLMLKLFCLLVNWFFIIFKFTSSNLLKCFGNLIKKSTLSTKLGRNLRIFLLCNLPSIQGRVATRLKWKLGACLSCEFLTRRRYFFNQSNLVENVASF